MGLTHHNFQTKVTGTWNLESTKVSTPYHACVQLCMRAPREQEVGSDGDVIRGVVSGGQ